MGHSSLLQCLSGAVALFLFSCLANAEVSDMPDYYDEPGSSSVRSVDQGLQGDSVDPLGGQLTVQNIDLFIPGNGGLDLEIRRNYSLHNAVRPGSFGQNTFNGYGPVGLGWDIHFGRIWSEEYLYPGACRSIFVATGRNPVLELADGSKQLMVNANTYYSGEAEPSNPNQASPDYITKNFWSASCIDTPYELNGETFNHGGMEVKTPEGLTYVMNYRGLVKGGRKDPSKPTDAFVQNSFIAYGVTEIRDLRGNWIKFEYADNGWLHVKRIYTSDNREVNFTYQNEGSATATLESISTYGQTVEYKYEEIDGYIETVHRLEEVKRPDGGKWLYSYGESGPGLFLLSSIENPIGGKTEYTYQEVQFESSLLLANKAVATKTVNAGIPSPSGTWTYTFTPGSPYDVTEIAGPDKLEVYTHFGVRGAIHGEVWKIGTLLEKEIREPTGTNILRQHERYEWQPLKISTQNEYRSSRNIVDTETHVPLLTKKTVTREGNDYITEFKNYDVLGRARLISESGQANNLADVNKETTINYYLDLPKWLILQSSETIADVGQTFRNYRDDGLVESESTYNTPRWYEYDFEGNVSRTYDGYSLGVNYSDYFRGIPRQEDHEEGVSISRTVNFTGTVATETNARGHTTAYDYDPLNRVTGITPPINDNVTVDWVFYGKSRRLVRGGMVDERFYDGFGREVGRNVSGEEPVSVNKSYDAAGRLIFESYPNSVDGISYDYDALGRVTQRSEPNGKQEVIRYLANNTVEITNGRGKVTAYTYRSFGDPDQKELVKIAGEESVVTDITRDKLGNITAVTQGGFTREFEYNDQFFLTAEVHPEIGRIEYDVDAVGNVRGKTTSTKL